MSTNFPNAVYVPTGTAEGKDYVQISGYCYKKVAENVTISEDSIRTSIIGDFTDCLDCNTCECGKTIDFFVGGFSYKDTSINFTEVKISIETSTSGWQEIAIESGFLNINPNTNKPDSSYSFKPTQIRCFDRKISMQSGIDASFNERNAEIAKFEYVSGADLYERQDLRYHSLTGGYGLLPTWDYLNQYDQIGIANTLNTIKFYNTCEFNCPTQDISFRLRGKVSESASIFNVGPSYEQSTTAWVYLTCTGVPQTPGQIIECIPSGSGLDFTDYFMQGHSAPAGYTVSFTPSEIDIVNMDLLLGNTGSDISKKYSNTGDLHFRDYWFGFGSTVSSYTSYITESGFYHLDTSADFDSFSEDIGIPFGIHYNKPPNCFDSSVTGTNFNTHYRHLGGNLRAEQASAGSAIGDFYTGCFQASEFADGIFKNGTYVPMYFTGIITGNANEYTTFIDEDELDPPASWSTGIYVYQWYKDGDRSQPNKITGYFGFMTGSFANEEVQKHYKSLVTNSTPININNPLIDWNIKSGNYPIDSAEKTNSCILINFGSEDGYKTSFEYSGSKIRHNNITDGNRFDNYGFSAIGTNSAMEYLDDPIWSTNTFLNTDQTAKTYPLVDSGDALHLSDNLINSTLNKTGDFAFNKIQSLKFQLKWNKV